MSAISEVEQQALNQNARERRELIGRFLCSLPKYMSDSNQARASRNGFYLSQCKTAAWTSASHIEKPPKPKEPPMA